MMTDRAALVVFGLAAVTISSLALLSLHHSPSIAVAVAVGATMVVARTWRQIRHHRRLVRELCLDTAPRHLAGVAVRSGSLGDAAFVAGLVRPTIFCDRTLPARLSSNELRAVLLHERAHQRAWDPVRLLLLEVAAPAVQRMPFGREWLAWTSARREISADRYAIEQGAAPRDLAGALLQLPALARAEVTGFASAVDLRLQALLGDDVDVMVPLAVRRARLLFPASVVLALGAGWTLHEHLTRMLGHTCC